VKNASDEKRDRSRKDGPGEQADENPGQPAWQLPGPPTRCGGILSTISLRFDSRSDKPYLTEYGHGLGRRTPSGAKSLERVMPSATDQDLRAR
jgi:hypothetical protein